MTHKLTAEEIKLRGTLLGSNKELLQLHRTLVRGGLISEEEFWETRQSLLKNQETLLKQKKPTPSTMKGDLKTLGEFHGEHKLILTPETIQMILSQNPSVLKAHKDYVPSRMSEKEFWTQYAKSKFFAGKESNDNSNPLNRYYEESIKEEDSKDTELKEAKVSKMVDLLSTADDHFSDYGNHSNHLSTSKGEQIGLSLIKKFNVHSMKILQQTIQGGDSTSVMSNPPIKIEDYTELEDLTRNDPEDTNVMSLDVRMPIPKKNVEFESNNLEEFRRDTLNMKLDVSTIIQKSMLTFNLRRSLLSNIVNTVPGSLEKVNLDSNPIIPPEIEIFHSNAVEVLRHFWITYPPGKDQERQAKLTRMATILQQLKIKGEDLITNSRIQNGDSLLTSIFVTIDRALAKYHDFFNSSNMTALKRAKIT